MKHESLTFENTDRGTGLHVEMFENGVNFTAIDNAVEAIEVTLTINEAQELAEKIDFFLREIIKKHMRP